jgi:acyl carrier protein
MFDATTWEIYTALLNGGTVICITHSTVVDTEALGRFIEHRYVQVSMMTPPVLKQLLRYSPRSLREFELLHVIGERLSVRDALQSQALVSGTLYNSYGPTEATILSTSHMIRDCDPPINHVPIGQAVEGAGAYVTDPHQRLVPLGVVEELVLTGPGVARGYIDPALNKDRFINLKVEAHSTRAYRTGDSVRICPRRRELEFLGRMDSQVKVRGQRVELGEIEHAIMAYFEEASDAVVVAREVEGYGLELVAFVVVKTGSACTIDEAELSRSIPSFRTQTAGEVTERLAAALPAYMVPAHVAVIPEVPLTANGKVDRRRLTMEAERMLRAKPVGKLKPAYVAPQSAVEIALCQTFADILQLPPDEVGATDTFFNLGGHSLMAMKLAARVSDKLRVSISVRDIFDHPIIVDLAAKIEAAGPARYDPIVACAAGRPAPLSFAQSRLWFLSEFGAGTSEYLMPLAARLSGPLNVPALRAAISAIEQRYHVLRSVFAHEKGDPVQVVRPHRHPDLPVVKVSAHDLERDLRAEQTRPFNLTREPGWRVRLFQLSTNENILSIVMHYIISDGWSVDLLCRELASFYKAARRQSP